MHDASAAPLASQADAPALWRLLGAAVLTFVSCRGPLFAIELAAASLGLDLRRCGPHPHVFGLGQAFANGFFRWDAGWYLEIALHGYRLDPDAQSSVAFYPLYPYLARYLGRLFGGTALAGLAISNVATVVALFYLRRLGALLFDDDVGRRAGVLLLVFPTSFFLSAFYTEGLFVCLACASMFCYFRGRFLLCGALGGCAMLTRSTGIVLFAALALDLAVKLYRREQRPRAELLALALIPLGLVGFLALLEHEVGDALAFIRIARYWSGGALPQRFIDAVFGGTFLALSAVMAWRRVPIALWAFVLLGVLLPLSTYGVGAMCRYVLILFPALLFAAHALQGRRGLELAVWFGSFLLLCLNSLTFLQCGWVG